MSRYMPHVLDVPTQKGEKDRALDDAAQAGSAFDDISGRCAPSKVSSNTGSPRGDLGRRSGRVRTRSKARHANGYGSSTLSRAWES